MSARFPKCSKCGVFMKRNSPEFLCIDKSDEGRPLLIKLWAQVYLCKECEWEFRIYGQQSLWAWLLSDKGRKHLLPFYRSPDLPTGTRVVSTNWPATILRDADPDENGRPRKYVEYDDRPGQEAIVYVHNFIGFAKPKEAIK